MHICKSLRLTALLGLGAMVLPGSARAVIVSLTPVTQIIGVGETAVVQLNVSDVADGVAPSIGSWLAHITYDSAVVSITSVTFGPELDLGVFGSIQFFDLATAGIVMADETSLEDTTDLNTSQPGSFTLATFSFTGVAPGISALTFARLELGDDVGFPLGFDSTTASINVGGVVATPDNGGVLAPLAICMAGAFLLRRRPRRPALPSVGGRR